MTETRVRELERRFRASGSVEDEAAWLSARVRAGVLEQGRLELAAELGSAAAARLTGRAPVSELEELLRKFEGWDDEVCRRFLFAVGRRRMLTERLRSVCAAAEESFVEGRLEREIQALYTRFDARQRSDPAGQFIVALAYCGYGYPRLFLRSHAVTWAEAQRALREEVVPWVLGHADPVRERLEAGEGAGE